MRGVVAILSVLFLSFTSLCCSGATVWYPLLGVESLKELSIRFRTVSPTIELRYLSDAAESDSLELFILDNNGVYRGLSATRELSGDTLSYFYQGIDYTQGGHLHRGFEFELFLPTASKVEWLEIGVERGAFLEYASPRRDLPIVTLSKGRVDWAAPISRLIGRGVQIVESLDEIAGRDVKLFIVDREYSFDDILELKREYASTPIVVQDKRVCESLKKEVEDIYYFNSKEGDLAQMCDFLRGVLHTPSGDISTTKPLTQRRVKSHEWRELFNEMIYSAQSGEYKCAILGNSIVQNWGRRTPDKEYAGQQSWDRYLGEYLNMGLGADRVENLLWRVYNDQLEFCDFEKIVVMIGTNNLNASSSYEDIAKGVDNLLHEIIYRQPSCEITLVGILPRRDIPWHSLQELNTQLESVAHSHGVVWRNVGAALMDSSSTPITEYYIDRVHLSAEGYNQLGKALFD